MKKCPFCREEIQDEAIKCRWCNEFLPIQPSAKIKWQNKTVTIFIGFLILGPFVLPLVWANPRYSQEKKIIATVLVIAATVAMIYAAGAITRQFEKQYQMFM